MNRLIAFVLVGTMTALVGCGAVSGDSISDATDAGVVAGANYEYVYEDQKGYDDMAEQIEAVQNGLVYMGGLHVTGNPNSDMELAIFKNSCGDLYHLVYEDGVIRYGMGSTSVGMLEDGREIAKLTVDDTEFGYIFRADLTGLLVDENGKVYKAVGLDETLARNLVKATLTGEL